jgi:hypothetical protein
MLPTAAPSAVVRACNYGGSTFFGWHRCVVDNPPPQKRGMVDGIEFAVGKTLGLLGTTVDVRLKLAPGQGIKADLAWGTAVEPPAPPSDLDTGLPIVGGAKVPLLTSTPNGAGADCHWHGRPWPQAPMFCVDAWATVYPGQGWAVGELVVTASNTAVPDLVATIPGDGLTLAWSNGVVLVDGLTFGAPLIPGGETFGNGQSRGFRFVFGWLERLDQTGAQSALAESAAAIAVNGISQPGLLGSFALPPHGFDPVGWAAQRLPRARSALFGWDILRDSRGGSVGVSPRAGDTGDQEDQPGVAKGVEEAASQQPGPYWVTYYAGLSQLRRPCHHLEADGSPLDWRAHKDLSMWVSQPNFPDGAAVDHLGKPRMVQLGAETHGWEGPDSEHNFLGRLAQALQWTGSPALQWELANQARLWLFTETLDPRFATTQITDASRAWGWQALVAAWCWALLEDRELAAAVKQRAHDRFALLYSRFGAVLDKQVQWFDVRFGDDRITTAIRGGFQAGTLAYQQSQAALMQIAGETLADPLMIEWAQKLALTAINFGWTQDATSRWVAWDMVGVNSDGSPLRADQMVEGNGAHRTGFFDTTWCAIAPWVVLRQDPSNARAKAILAYLQSLPTTPPNQPIRTNDWLLPIGARRPPPSDGATVTATPVPIAPGN